MKRYVKSMTDDEAFFDSFDKQDWINYICLEWAEDGTPDYELKQVAEDLEYGLYDEWIDSIKDTLGDLYPKFKRCLNIKGDEDYVDVAGRRIYTKSEAAEWLNDMIEEHGNTYFWDDELNRDLNKLIKKFGNTYFWNR